MNDELRSDILHRWHGGQSRRGIARDLGLSRRSFAVWATPAAIPYFANG
jgi:hypothetical protein